VKEEEKQAEERDLKSVIASASHTQLSHILLDLCRHSKTAADLTRSHLVQTAVPVAVPVAAPAAPAAPAIAAIPAIQAIQAIPAVLRVPASRTPNEASKPPKVLRSILKRRKDDIVSYASYASYSSSGESTQNPSRPDDASPSLGRGSATRRPPSVAFSQVTSTASATTSTMSSSSSSSSEISSSKSSSKSDSNSQSKSSSSSSSSSSKGKSKSKSKTGPVPESDSPNSKKRKGPTSALTRCRNCGSEYPNVTPNPSPNGNKSTPSNGGREEEEICVHHSGKFRPIYPPSTVF
jgi:hypothetical protein